MDNKQPSDQDESLITLEADDGAKFACQLIDIFSFDNQDYALLLKDHVLDEKKPAKESKKAGEEDEGAIVVMRLVQRDDQYIFQTIDNDSEFEKVTSYIEELAAQSLNETTEASPERRQINSHHEPHCYSWNSLFVISVLLSWFLQLEKGKFPPVKLDI